MSVVVPWVAVVVLSVLLVVALCGWISAREAFHMERRKHGITQWHHEKAVKRKRALDQSLTDLQNAEEEQ